jgi:hypothetical protein
MIILDVQITECDIVIVKRKVFQTQSIIMTLTDTDYKMF